MSDVAKDANISSNCFFFPFFQTDMTKKFPFHQNAVCAVQTCTENSPPPSAIRKAVNRLEGRKVPKMVYQRDRDVVRMTVRLKGHKRQSTSSEYTEQSCRAQNQNFVDLNVRSRRILEGSPPLYERKPCSPINLSNDRGKRLCPSNINCVLFLVWILVLFGSIRGSYGLSLEGSPGSYIRYPQWYHSFENDLSFEFKTSSPEGLLFYFDDGGISNFYEISIYGGKIAARFKIGRRKEGRRKELPVTTIEMDETVSDNKWHKLTVRQTWQHITLRVDLNPPKAHEMSHQDWKFGNMSNSDVFVGGIPSEMPISLLSQPLVQMLPRFKGSFRNLLYRIYPHGVTAPHILNSHGTRRTEEDYCITGLNPCLNNGICYSTDNGPQCDCSYVDYNGQHCQHAIPVPEASFLGNEFLSYDFSNTRNGMSSREEELRITFKTKRGTGMLFYSGELQDYLHLALKNGAVVATSNLGSGPREIVVDPYRNSRRKLHDNQWHTLVLHRRLQLKEGGISSLEMSLTVDGERGGMTHTQGSYEWLSHVVAYVGGKPANKILPRGLVDTNFYGCLKAVRYRADARYLDFLNETLKGSEKSMVRPFGNLSFVCRDNAPVPPVSFLSSNAYFTLSSWQTTDSGTISFRFRTNEPDGLILFNSAPGANLSSDFIAFELLDGRLHVAMNLGSGSLRIQPAISGRLDDGRQWHSVVFYRERTSGFLTVDGEKTPYNNRPSSKSLELGGLLYVGALPWTNPGYLANIPPYVWTAALRKGFVGCIRDLKLNGLPPDVHGGVLERGVGEVELGCGVDFPLCPTAPCRNGGVCREGWRRFICDCSNTPKDGHLCTQDPITLSFERFEDSVRVVLPYNLRSQAEDVWVKFRSKNPSGILVATALSSLPFLRDQVVLYLKEGRLFIQYNLGNGKHTHDTESENLCDGEWHSVRVKRRGQLLRVDVDGGRDGAGASFAFSGLDIILEYDTLFAGRSKHGQSIDSIAYPRSRDEEGGAFLGEMSSFYFNGIDVFLIAAAENGTHATGRIVSTGSKTPSIGKVFAPKSAVGVGEGAVTFERSSYAVFPERLIAGKPLFHLFFQFKSLDPDGLIFYASGLSNDFVAIELHNGHLRYSFNSGNGPETLVSNTGSSLNDFKWHFVLVYQKRPEEHFLVVDTTTTKLLVTGQNKELNLKNNFYVGGVEEETMSSLPRAIASRHGYAGCVAGLKLNSDEVDMLNENVRQSGVRKGCEGPNIVCEKHSCANGGVCVQRWTSYSCDCLMTSYTGHKCDKESIGYEFGPNPGLIVYEYPKEQRPSTQMDVLVVGIKTRQQDAVVFKVECVTANDFLMLEVSGGHAVVVYHLGTEEHRVTDFFHLVNDGEYHIIRFTRTEQNATFRLDNHTTQYKTPVGQQLRTLNTQSELQIGGVTSSGFNTNGIVKRQAFIESIDRPFVGLIQGLYFNGLRPLDLAAENDARIDIRHIGDVYLANSGDGYVGTEDDNTNINNPDNWNLPPPDLPPPLRPGLENRMMSSSSSMEPPDNDEMIGSGGSGSGCELSDEQRDDEECIYDNKEDNTELITPDPKWLSSTTRSTKVTTTTQTPTPTRRKTTTTTTPLSIDVEIFPDEGSGGNPDEWGEGDIYETGEQPPDEPPIPDPPRKTVATIPPTHRPRRPTTTPPTLPQTKAPSVIIPDDDVEVDPEDPGRSVPSVPPAPRPTAGGKPTTTSTTPAPSADDPFDRTGFISGISIALILIIIIVVFLVFKCYNRNKSTGSSYTMEEATAIKPLCQGEVGPGTTPVITTRVTQVNGYQNGKKKKNFKEWYV